MLACFTQSMCVMHMCMYVGVQSRNPAQTCANSLTTMSRLLQVKSPLSYSKNPKRRGDGTSLSDTVV